MKKCHSSNHQAARSEQQRYVSQLGDGEKEQESRKPQPLYHPNMMNFSEVPLSLGVPMLYCNWEELPPKCGRGSSSAAGRQGSCEGWKTSVLRKQKRVGSRPRLWLRCTKQGFSCCCCPFLMCGLVVLWSSVCFVLCAVRCRCSFKQNC